MTDKITGQDHYYMENGENKRRFYYYPQANPVHTDGY